MRHEAVATGLQEDSTVSESQRSAEALKLLAACLTRRREPILSACRRAVDRDPELTTASTITRSYRVPIAGCSTTLT